MSCILASLYVQMEKRRRKGPPPCHCCCRRRLLLLLLTFLSFCTNRSRAWVVRTGITSLSSSRSSGGGSQASQGRIRRAVVIGGGAAGFMGAIEAGRAATAAGLSPGEFEVVIIEGSRQILQKVRISGGGRCNVMHDKTKPVDEILRAYPRGQRELLGNYKSVFGPVEAHRWFESEGVTLKVEADGRVFPITDDSSTIVDCLRQAADRAGVKVMTGTKARSITPALDGGDDDGAPLLVAVEGQGGVATSLACDRVLLATGSSPEGHRLKVLNVDSGLVMIAMLARELGHSIVSPVPSLFTLDVKGDGRAGPDMAGVAAKDVQVRLDLSSPQQQGGGDPTALKSLLKSLGLRNSKQMPSTRGPLLFTHTGLSGPAILKLSAFGARIFHHFKYRASIVIDWAPTYTYDELMERLERAKITHWKKALATFCPLGPSGEEAMLPRRLWAKLVLAAGLGGGDDDGGGGGMTWGSLTPKQLKALANEVHETKMQTTGKGTFKEEFVTCGGVSLKEVDMKAMASKVVHGLHFAGEVCDIDAITGGYNFQSCWTTGWTAGRAIGQALASSSSSSSSLLSSSRDGGGDGEVRMTTTKGRKGKGKAQEAPPP